ncbi:threonine synthase [Geodermatophilus sp. Leaf369]|uniref:threonine synthase n=1 Tax=Geodermatophilus sp. Leaf369 TaxID=1736354 RepID=UPI0006F1D23E|nr:threonine synthase [Geodermatophilus sp. Leaf369]KQS61103.1 threonine synthase [Geodermatophilus sp. Leaf369]QNG37496.1 threonine synthase [Geodermatophilaceae bacterium NBWT11]
MTAPVAGVAAQRSTQPIPTNPARGLVCRNCGATFGLIAEHACAECFGPLEVDYDPELMRAVTREQIEAGPQNIWRYSALLPTGQDPESRVSLDPGMTPLVRAQRLGDELGFTAPLWVKDDSANPTHSFKDRVVSLAATAARGFGYAKIACASTGNLANSVAAHAARTGLPSFVFVPSDLEPGKIVQSAVYGQTLVAVDGSYDDVNRLTSELAETDEFEDCAFVNQNVRPYYAEGSKTVGYEIAEQLGWRIPAQVVIPMASGSLLTKVDKAWRELVAAGIVADTEWTVYGAQSAGCDPIATAFENGWDVVKPVKPTGIAKSLNIGNPADGPYALDAIRRTGGSVGRVGDAEIVQGIRDLARTTGVFAETAGGVTTAVLRQLVERGVLDPAKETVVLNTGEGLKTLDPLAPVVGPTHRVDPSLKSVRAAGLIS